MNGINVNELVAEIKKKKTLKSLPDFFVRKEIAEYLRKYPNAGWREVFKSVRRKLHESYGAFQTRRKRKRYLYLEELKIVKEENGDKIVRDRAMEEIRERILKTSVSSRERLEADYKNLYRQIRNTVGKFHSIMDLGSGINPVSFEPVEFRDVKIYSYDIDKNDTAFLNDYFKVMELNGEARVLDIHDLDRVERLPHVDVCLLFKVIDPLERRGHLFSEHLIERIRAEYIIVSFATKTITKRAMNHPQRGWFERMIKRLGKTFTTIRTKNEIYYVVKK